MGQVGGVHTKVGGVGRWGRWVEYIQRWVGQVGGVGGVHTKVGGAGRWSGWVGQWDNTILKEKLLRCAAS